VDPAVTLFRPGSISKTFTWTAVMQLFEQGKLDLDADMRNYLNDVVVPETFSQPITMNHLMAHSPGFEVLSAGGLGNDPETVAGFRDFMRHHQPKRVRPPGVVSSYSNYGTALAGMAVADLTGMAFESYVDQHIFQPLDMNDSTFRELWTNLEREPMPQRLAENRSPGYTWTNGGFAAHPMEFIHKMGPAGSMSTTATDMARWMLLHLGGGTLDGVQILAPETARLMHRQHFNHDPAVPGMAHGFMEYRIPGYRAFGHAGGTSFFVSQMVMVPELGFGLFASSNSRGGANVVMDLPALVVDRFFPGPENPKVVDPPSDSDPRNKRLAGTYVTTRRSYTAIAKIGIIESPTVVSLTDDGFLVTSSSGESQRWVESAPLTFREVDGHEVLKFVEDEHGRIIRFLTDKPYFVMDRAGPLEKPSTVYVLVGLSVIAGLGALIAAWYRRKQPIEQSGSERCSSLVLTLAALCWLVFFPALILGLSSMGSPHYPSPLLVTSLVIALIGAALTMVSAVLLYPVWSRRSWPVGRRLRHTAIVLIFVDLVFLLYGYNVIGFNFF
jgi:CubicO group peptidase (beta-lactamase class C family)